MTLYKTEHEETGADGETVNVKIYLEVKCDSCGEERTVETTDQLRDGWYIDNDFCKQGVHLCPSCRYQGATVQFLQWGLNPNKMGVDIVGALKSTLRICDNVEQIIGELKSKLSRVLMPDEGGPDKAVYEQLDRIVNLINMARANDNIALAELADFGR